jgi:hypothetical protein
MGASPAYQVVWSNKATAVIKAILASLRGDPRKVAGFEQTIRTVHQQLRRTPLSVGTTRGFVDTIEERVADLELVSIDFAVDIQRQLVLVRDCTPLTSSNP